VAQSRDKNTDIIVCGAGATGLIATLALRSLGLQVTLVGKLDTRRTARTVALLDGSVRLLKNLNVFPLLLPYAAALRTMRIVDATGALFRAPTVEFQASEIGLQAFGWNIENADLADRLRPLVDDHLIDDQLVGFRLDGARIAAVCATGATLSARLLIAADGRHSPTRAAAQIGTREWTYPQVALTAILKHRVPHAEASTEFHTRQGPFTLVPLPDRAGPRSSLVWMLSPPSARRLRRLDAAALAAAIERQSQSILGEMALEGPTSVFPMAGLQVERLTAPRLALVGEAAHVFPPIGAQGLNLGLRDVAHLVDCIEAAAGDPGSAAVLSAYTARRRADITLRTGAVDLLNRSLLSGFAPVDALRSSGLIALAAIAPLRRSLMRAGVMPSRPLPRLMRG
jgi:2-octaprenyl-6-methoxyphenol hydroxylase